MLDRRTTANELFEQLKPSNECWLARCLPSEVLPFSWARFLDELAAADETQRTYSLRRD